MRVISLFSGCGGMDLGFVQAGHEIVWSNDCWHDAVQTYRKNIGNHIVCSEIEKVDLNSIPDGDIVIGGFPCQGFSVANTKRTSQDKRNGLYKFFVKIVTAKNPQFFLAENVKGILNLDGGAAFKRILRDFSDAGYSCTHVLLNAANFGVPQFRQRVFILGVRNDVEAHLEFPPKATHFDKGIQGGRKFISVAEAFKGLPDPDDKHNLVNHVYTQYKVKYNGYISNRKLDPSRPAPTVTARGDDRGGAVIMPHPFQKRRMSCRELAIVQGFPLKFEFYGTMTSVYRQIGNAVPPPLAKAIALELSSVRIKELAVNYSRNILEEQLVFD
ncbi:MAG: DNA cytosine methyltransferase [Candidatus Omnitrophota bacterium]